MLMASPRVNALLEEQRRIINAVLNLSVSKRLLTSVLMDGHQIEQGKRLLHSRCTTVT